MQSWLPADTDTRGVRMCMHLAQRGRGPYLRIRCFCEYGVILAPEPYACREHGGGRQHAEYTDDTERFGRLGFHFGTIMAATGYDEFLDAGNVDNVMNSIAIVENPAAPEPGQTQRRYLVALMSNVLRKNSAADHRDLATAIDRLIARLNP